LDIISQSPGNYGATYPKM